MRWKGLSQNVFVDRANRKVGTGAISMVLEGSPPEEGADVVRTDLPVPRYDDAYIDGLASCTVHTEIFAEDLSECPTGDTLLMTIGKHNMNLTGLAEVQIYEAPCPNPAAATRRSRVSNRTHGRHVGDTSLPPELTDGYFLFAGSAGGSSHDRPVILMFGNCRPFRMVGLEAAARRCVECAFERLTVACDGKVFHNGPTNELEREAYLAFRGRWSKDASTS